MSAEVALPAGTKTCPWCGQIACKDEACNHVVCGVMSNGRFQKGMGCGRQWCFHCEGRLCGVAAYDQHTGVKTEPPPKMSHTSTCCVENSGDAYDPDAFCVGGHNSHMPPRK